MRGLWEGMMEGRPLPALTEVILRHGEVFILGSVLIGGVGLSFLFGARGFVRGVCVSMFSLAFLLFQWQMTLAATQQPLVDLMNGLGS
jgi:hypothetical protein